ncbi:MAG: hypothetical protein ACOX3T_04115 [Bdellovibrionota bacterium]
MFKTRKNFTLNITLLSLFLFFAHCIFISLNRLIARDEGFYIIASELLLKNKILYKDFFFPQMPFTALFYAFCMKMFGVSWYVARGITGIIYFLTGSLLFFHIKKNSSLQLAKLSLILFAIHPMAFSWLTVIKSYALVNLFLLAIFILIESYLSPHKKNTKNNTKKIFVIGVLFGLLTLTRLHFASLFPLIFFHIYVKQGRLSKKDFAYFTAGSILALLPAIYYFILSQEIFIFNNFGYHLVRSQDLIEKTLLRKASSLSKILGLSPSNQVIKKQMFITYFIPILWGVCYFFFMLKKKNIYFPILYTLYILILNLIPTPTYLQYQSCIIIFITVMSVDFIKSLNNIFLKSLIALMFISTNAFYYPSVLKANTLTAHNVIGISGQNPEIWSIHAIEKINEHINKLDTKAYLLSIWPGHSLGSKHKLLPGTENPFLVRVPIEISRKYNTKMKKDILEDIANHNVGIVVYNFGNTLYKIELKNFLIENNFLLYSRIGDIFIWSKE